MLAIAESDSSVLATTQGANVVRAIVLSDIHATVDVNAATHVAEATANARNGNALSAARPYLSEHVSEADLVLCPGDLVHRGDPSPMDWVWRELHSIADSLGATVIGSVGNHDLLTQPRDGDEPSQNLRALHPLFPHDESTVVRCYWADSFGVIETPDWRVISLNSCYIHGGFDQGEIRHGRLKEQCLPGIEQYLDNADGHPAVNICMVHHHPQEWSYGGQRMVKHLRGGDRLIELLDAREERWLLLHGHTHFPALGYFGHSSHGPVRLAAASVGINLLSDTGIEVRNQMHVIDFELAESRRLGLPIAGQITSYTWTLEGWTDANVGGGLPPHAAFGYRRDGQDLARELIEKAHEAGCGVYLWDQIVEQLEPRLRYLAPLDREELLRGFVRLGAGVARDDNSGFLEVTLR
jgi:hypothetical protein